jgi:hypothetical protein
MDLEEFNVKHASIFSFSFLELKTFQNWLKSYIVLHPKKAKKLIEIAS